MSDGESTDTDTVTMSEVKDTGLLSTPLFTHPNTVEADLYKRYVLGMSSDEAMIATQEEMQIMGMESASGSKAAKPVSDDETDDTKLANDPSIFPKDDCSVCLAKLFPNAHGSKPEIREAKRNRFSYHVFQGSDCRHMLHRGCAYWLFEDANGGQPLDQSTVIVAKCPICRRPLKNKSLKRIRLKGMCDDDVVLVYEDMKNSPQFSIAVLNATKSGSYETEAQEMS